MVGYIKSAMTIGLCCLPIVRYANNMNRDEVYRIRCTMLYGDTFRCLCTCIDCQKWRQN